MSIQALKSAGSLLKINTFNFLTSFACVSITQLALRHLKDHPERICEKLNIDPENVTVLRKSLGILTLTSIPAFFFKNSNVSGVQFLKSHPLLVATTFVDILNQTTTLANYFSDKEVVMPIGITNLVEKITPPSMLPEIFQEDNSSFYDRVIKATGIEQLLFRVILQEGLLRKVPQYILRARGISPECVDYSAFKIARVFLSACLWGGAHLNKFAGPDLENKSASVNTFKIWKKTVSGLSNAYLQETLGFLPSFISHYGNNFTHKPPGF